MEAKSDNNTNLAPAKKVITLKEYSAVEQFGFPYKNPYQVQSELMSRVYSMLADSKVKLGLYSSPTGTGKSLSLICSVLSFYMDPKITAKAKET